MYFYDMYFKKIHNYAGYTSFIYEIFFYENEWAFITSDMSGKLVA